ncbi:MAG: nitroreductase family deazaflavin-dependent oxidoreductase [Candidatus Binatus sp.]|jgi:deazaflavin-dependent oxidoreductase (nitroreductase family)|uniref:nitroreductase family deazaflavin-dependent oxidoreductase n=1 Tax=Candidatus Binatus sp. TaxID=2811406 RepID=UPI003D0DFB2C
MPPTTRVEPFAAKLHFIPRSLRPVQAAIVNSQRDYFSHAAGWVLLTTTGRRTGLPRETLLPCVRSDNHIYLISTYGWQSDWIRNLRKNPKVKVTCNGEVVAGHGKMIEKLDDKIRIVSEHPFFAPAPFELVNAVALSPAMRPLLVAFLRRWVASRPVVAIRI